MIGAAWSVGVGLGTAARLGADLRERGWLHGMHGLLGRGGSDVVGPFTGDRYQAYLRAVAAHGLAGLAAAVADDTFIAVTDTAPVHAFRRVVGHLGRTFPDQGDDAVVLFVNVSLAVRRAYERVRQMRCGGPDLAPMSACMSKLPGSGAPGDGQ